MNLNDLSIADRDAYYKAILDNMTMMSDMFMRNVLKDQDCAEFVIQTIMQNKSLRIVDVVVELDLKNMHGRSAVLDCVARDADGKMYNIEIQQQEEGASPLRARYYASLLDMNTLDVGMDFGKLPETYVIFITRSDVLGYGIPVYHIKRWICEKSVVFGDKSVIIYVDSSNVQHETEVGRLMHDFRCKNASEMHSKVLANRVSMLKDSPEGVRYMCTELKELEAYGFKLGWEQGVQQGVQQGIQQGRDEGAKQTSEKTVLNMLSDGFSPERIAKYVSNMSLEQIKTLDAKRCSL